MLRDRASSFVSKYIEPRCTCLCTEVNVSGYEKVLEKETQEERDRKNETERVCVSLNIILNVSVVRALLSSSRMLGDTYYGLLTVSCMPALRTTTVCMC